MATLSNQLSTWRKLIIECKAGIVTTVDFKDTRPNVMFIMNPTECVLLASIDSTPTEKQYDFKIKEHYTRLIGKPTRTCQCYIYNTSKTDCTVQVYSLYDVNFDPSWIKDFNIENVNISEETLKKFSEMISGKVTIDGVEPGVTIPVSGEILHNIYSLLTNVNWMKGFTDVTNINAMTNYLSNIMNGVMGINGSEGLLNVIINQLKKIHGNETLADVGSSVDNLKVSVDGTRLDMKNKFDDIYGTLMTHYMSFTSGGAKNISTLDNTLNSIKQVLEVIHGTDSDGNAVSLKLLLDRLNTLLKKDPSNEMFNLANLYNAILSVRDKIETLTHKVPSEKLACAEVLTANNTSVFDVNKQMYVTMIRNESSHDTAFKMIDENDPVSITLKPGETINCRINAGSWFGFSGNDGDRLIVVYEK